MINFRFVAPQLYEEFTEVGSIVGILLLNYINTGASMNLFLFYFCVLYYILSVHGPPVQLLVWAQANLKIKRLSQFDPIL